MMRLGRGAPQAVGSMLQSGCTNAVLQSKPSVLSCKARAAAQAAGGAHVLVKTHAWSGAWGRAAARGCVLVTHRDLRGVVASYRRMGWAADLEPDYVLDHLRWRVRSC